MADAVAGGINAVSSSIKSASGRSSTVEDSLYPPTTHEERGDVRDVGPSLVSGGVCKDMNMTYLKEAKP